MTFMLLWIASAPAIAIQCPPAESFGPAPTRLVVVVPGMTPDAGQWSSLRARLKADPQSGDLAWLFINHEVGVFTRSSARDEATAIGGCIEEKVQAHGFGKVTLVGHSAGGMLARYAYLEAAGAIPDRSPPPDQWAKRVDRVLLFASINRGISSANVNRWNPMPEYVDSMLRGMTGGAMSDLIVGSDFISEVRLAWIRHFANNLDQGQRQLPWVIQFWGTADPIVSARDNADLEAFSGPVLVRLPGADHNNVMRVETPFTADPDARWSLLRPHFFGPAPATSAPVHRPKRVLFILRGIRDSAYGDWIPDIRQRAESASMYGAGNVEPPDYGYFSAARFASSGQREKLIPMFRDQYAQRLAENPLTEFDFIGHSNGTYVLGHALRTTPSMRFNNVVLAAPVLPTSFDWRTLFRLGQVKKLRYDVASDDWAVGILTQMLRAFFQSDVGPAGVVGFGEGRAADSRVQLVGWYAGGHGAALQADPKASGPDNRSHLLAFAWEGRDLATATPLSREIGPMQLFSRITPYGVWFVLVVLAGFMVAWAFRRLWVRIARISIALGLMGLVLYVALDTV